VKRTLVALALVVVFVLALATPAFAMYHTASYKFEGTINFKTHAGHACNTGAEFKQLIEGAGTMDKTMSVLMKPGIITINDVNDWVAGATPLTVTSVWELCTPPKYTYDGVDVLGQDMTAPVAIGAMYPNMVDYPGSFVPRPVEFGGGDLAEDPSMIALGATVYQLADFMGWDPLTSQIWAVQVKADPGFSGNLHQKGEAAYGPFLGGEYGYEADWDLPYGPLTWQFGDLEGTLDTLKSYSDHWRWEENKDGYLRATPGADYVGDYFTMEQMARTSQGTLRRYIDVSSPWSHAYLHEDMSVVGTSKISDAFEMKNIAAGADILKDWWLLF